MSRIVAVVPCKGSSERISRKNLRLVGGLPLWLGKARQLARMGLFNEVYVDTDDVAVAYEAKRHGFTVIERPAKVNGYDGNELLAWESLRIPRADVYVQALCTAPFVGADAIRECVRRVMDGADTACVVEKRRDYRAGAYVRGIPGSDSLEPFVRDCMSVYAVSGDYLVRTGLRVGGRAVHVEVDGVQALDLDWESDLTAARWIAEGMRSADSRGLRALEGCVSSALLSDVLEQLGVEEYSMEFDVRPRERRIGRACTLKLVYADSDDAVDDIYGALEHYDWCMPGDILMVETGPVYAAYFGELNSLLGKRAGAIGCVVECSTRDSSEVVLPVWSDYVMSSDCRDVLGVGGIGCPISIQGVEIEHGDLVCADADGVVRVPWVLEDEVVRMALSRAEDESRVKMRIAYGLSAEDIVSSSGKF